MAVEMLLGGVAIGQEFPLYSQNFEFVRPDEQGAAYKKIIITLGGFLEGADHEALMALYNVIRGQMLNDTTFTYKDGSTIIHDNQHVWLSGYAEPEDEYGKCRLGDYSISFYYFEQPGDNLNLTVSYNGFVFPNPPKFGRKITPIRADRNTLPHGSTAVVGLSGFIFCNTHAELLAQMAAFEAAMNDDGTLTYGALVQPCRAAGCSIEENVLMHWFFYTVQLEYEVGEYYTLKRKLSISRIHEHPVITEEPFCNRRLVELMNTSGQYITYRFFMSGQSVPSVRALLSEQVALEVEPGGIEMPGGGEDWDKDECSVDLTFTKFYQEAVIQNMIGT